jgi:hypothetical protein
MWVVAGQVREREADFAQRKLEWQRREAEQAARMAKLDQRAAEVMDQRAAHTD